MRLYHNQTSIRLVDEIGNTILESAYVWPSPTFAFAIILQLASDSEANWIYTPRPGKYLWHGEMLNTPGAKADVRKALIRRFNRYRRKRPKVDAGIFDSAPSHTRRSDASGKKR